MTTVVEIKGYTLRYNNATHEWDGAGVPTDFLETVNWWSPPENYYRSVDPSPGLTRAKYLVQEFGAKILRHEFEQREFDPNVVF